MSDEENGVHDALLHIARQLETQHNVTLDIVEKLDDINKSLKELLIALMARS